jgi:transcription elongation factor Elf1
MVHYGPTVHPIQPPSPICPKCGSHRTQIVGRSEDAKVLTIRCSSCGERSSVDVRESARQEDVTLEQVAE